MENADNYSKALIAIKIGNLDHLKRLLSEKELAQISDTHGRRLIHWAAMDAPTTDILLEILKNDSVNWEDKYQSTPLYKAIRRGEKRIETDFIRVLLQNGADPNKPKNLLLEALTRDNIRILNNFCVAKSLIEAGADVNFSNFCGWTPIHEASKKQDSTLVQLLLKNGAIIDVKNDGASTPLHCATNFQCLRTLKTILKVGKQRGSSCIDWVNDEGDTALFMACRLKTLSKDFVKVLLQAGANPNIRNIKKKGKTPLIQALKEENEAVVKILITNGADVDAPDFRGNTPLHVAATKERSNFVHLLLKSEANIDTKNSEKETPLHMATKKGCAMSLKALLIAATEIGKVKDMMDVKSSDGTALKIAEEHGLITCEEILLEFGADPKLA